ncbi:hypothetical protein [Bacillus badius]|uniref:hypothetical protein n=1 Tax=Bacillus badius TaxID=1455 RepID=UPI0007B37474|nr:hypothetical protein [Bacillus badius]KZR59331.1 hypothetical protein A3781_13095 [Bacillus badius]
MNGIEILRQTAESFTQFIVSAFMLTNVNFADTGCEIKDYEYLTNFDVYEVQCEENVDSPIEIEEVLPSLEYLNEISKVKFEKRIPVLLVQKEIEEKNSIKNGGYEDGVIVLYQPEQKDTKEETNRYLIKTLVHEFGHHLDQNLNDTQLNDFKRERLEEAGITKQNQKDKLSNTPLKWENRPDEVFAEDISSVLVNKEDRVYLNKTNAELLENDKAFELRELTIKALQKKYKRNDNHEKKICANQGSLSKV